MSARENKKVYIKTYGCQMNVYDSVRMGDILQPLGYTETDSSDDADMVILNTCHIREKASEKVYSELGRIRRQKEKMAKQGKQMLVGVAGCVAQAEGEEIMKREPIVDMVFGPQSYHHLPELVHKATRDLGGTVELDFPEISKFDYLPETTQNQGASAYVSVQEGCDKFCTFCVVPYTRGAEYSRTVEAIEAEIRQHLANGTQEVHLLGQNVNAYHGVGTDGAEWSLAKLIRHLAEIDGLERIRYMTSHPRDMDDDLIAAHGEVKKLMPYLHLPVQSGSDNTLKAMNRKHTAKEYMTIIEKLRAVRPDIAFSSDFIVGFPGETDEDFEATMTLVETVFYGSGYSFKYSQRPGTPAATSEDQVDDDVKTQRLARLQALIVKQQRAFNESCVGMEMDILLERAGREAGQLIGKSPYLQSVHVDNAEHLLDKMVKVRIVENKANSLRAELISDHKVAA